MDKDHERERKLQQNERQQIVVSTDHQPSVDEHFEESLRRAKEKQQRSSSWSSQLSLGIHPGLGHPSILQGIGHPGASLSVLPSQAASISVTRTELGKSNNSVSLSQQQIFDAQRKQSLGIPVNYQAQAQQQAQQEASRRKEYEDRERERAEQVRAQHDRQHAYYWKMSEEDVKRQQAAVAVRHEQAMKHSAAAYAKFSPVPTILTQQSLQAPPPSSKSQQQQVAENRYKIKEQTIQMSPYPFYYKDSKSGAKHEHILPNPPPLMSDIHSSQAGVIVKHDTKSSSSSHKTTLHQPYSNIIPASSAGGHHVPYDVFPPTTSSLSNSATDRYGRPVAVSQQSPSPHAQHVQSSVQSSPQHKSSSGSGGPSPPTSTFSMVVVPSKQKVSSPAPSHIYGKPSMAGDNVVQHSAIPHNRTQEIPHPAKPPMLFQPQMTQLSYHPPPAHSSRSGDREKLYQVPTRQPTHGMPMLGIPHPMSSVSPLPPPESHTSSVSPHHIDRKNFSPSPKLQNPLTSATNVPHQTEPLDLGVASSSKNRGSDDVAPRRKSSTPFPISSMIEPKKMRIDPPLHNDATTIIGVRQTPPPAAVSPFEGRPPNKPPIEALLMKPGTPDIVVAAATKLVSSSPKPPEIVKSLTPPAANTTPTPTPTSTPPAADPPKQSSFTAPRHLKKAWLQRHTGEDFEDTTGVIGSGNCIKLPLKLENATAVVNNSGTTTTNSTTTNNNVLTGNGKEEPVANNIKTETNSVSENKLVQGKKGGNTSTNNVRDATANNDETGEKNVAREEASGSDLESESEKNSDTDKESMSGKSDSGSKRNGTRNSHTANKTPGKRGRRPKQTKEEINNVRQVKQQLMLKNDNDPFCKPPIARLKKTGEPFLQDGACSEVAPKLGKCRECRWTQNQKSKSQNTNIFCRFYAFRKLKYNKNGQLAIAGFSDPNHDPKEDDLKIWIPDENTPPPELDLQISRFLLAQVADQFCELWQQEQEAIKEHMNDDKIIAWKRVVQGVREMCDVCETTLFNYHWVCEKCGFVVCIDCYKSRKQNRGKRWVESKDRDDCYWLLCTNRQAHDQERLMLTQIIAGSSLNQLGKQAHDLRALWDIPQHCGCSLSKDPPPKSMRGMCKELIAKLLKNDMNKNRSLAAANENSRNNVIKSEPADELENSQNSPLTWLADVALKQSPGLNGFEGEDNSNDKDLEDDDGHSALRDLLTRPANKKEGVKKPPKKAKLESLDNNLMGKSILGKMKKVEEEVDITTKSVELKHYIGKNRKKRTYYPIRIMTYVESKLLYPNVPHQWLCDGKLLRLQDPAHSDNFRIFQEQWKRGQPVICSDVHKRLNMNLWTPESFSRDFGEDKSDLINCMSGNIVPNQQMKKFWDGFDHLTKRLKDDKGEPMLLKLKDWPPGDDFAEIMPDRFSDMMKSLPLGDYTQREGKLNLASRLPDCFVRPDLGPKMYNAYGSALYPTKGTTNLHLDISDAVNVMVYVGIPRDGNADEHIKEAFRAIDDAGCDILTRRRVREKNELPGALWHIYAARDADKIRDLLNRVAIEKGERLEPDHDPIHDQSWYLDGPLRERLYKEYGVEGYPIVQCLGDAVFVPAGAPHQVRNLHNCIKIAEDYVSPENIAHCFHMTQEFRELSDSHSNHEDKLQIKNIIYHVIKDSIAVLSHLISNEISESQSSSVSYPLGNNISGGSVQNSTVTTTKIEPCDIKEESNM